MLEFLPKDVQDGLEAAHRKGRTGTKTRMRIKVAGQTFPVLRSWDKGFALGAQTAQRLRGHVDLYDGARHVGSCLIVACGQQGDEMIYEYKRNTPVCDRAPVDFVLDDAAPVALIPR